MSLENNLDFNITEFDEYQRLAKKTAIYEKNKEMDKFYPFLGLAEEAGEVLGQAKRIIRDDEGVLTEERKNRIIKELGDLIWYASAVCNEMNISFSEVANINLTKLFRRKAENKIHGSGSDR